MIKALALFGPKAHWTEAEFTAHYLERHAALCAGTHSFTRLCARYVQNVRIDTGTAAHDTGSVRRAAISEMWFKDAGHLSATYAAEDYLTRLRPDELRFADFASARVWLCQEREVWAAPAVPTPDPDKQWAAAPRIQLFHFRSRRAGQSDGPAGDRWAQACGALLADLGRACEARRYVLSEVLSERPADLPRPADDRTMLIEQFSFNTIGDACEFQARAASHPGLSAAAAELTDNDRSMSFIGRSHVVFE